MASQVLNFLFHHFQQNDANTEISKLIVKGSSKLNWKMMKQSFNIESVLSMIFLQSLHHV